MAIDNLYSQTSSTNKDSLENVYPDSQSQPKLKSEDLYAEKVKVSEDKLEEKDNVNQESSITPNVTPLGSIDTTTIQSKPLTDLGNLYK